MAAFGQLANQLSAEVTGSPCDEDRARQQWLMVNGQWSMVLGHTNRDSSVSIGGIADQQSTIDYRLSTVDRP
jgi:hypothetical protein